MISKVLYFFSKPVVKSYMAAMLRTNVFRHGQMPEGAKIIAANHPSTTDPFFVASLARQQVYILINNVLFQVPILGTYLHKSGHIPVIAGNGQAAMRAALELLAEGKTVVIFPEGDLSPIEGGFLPPRTGVARLALLSGAPVIPVGIHLERERLHTIRSIVKGRVEYGRWYIRGKYNMTVGQPLYFRGDPEDRPYVRAVAERVMQHITEMARQSENRMHQGPASLLSLPAAN